MEGNLFLVLNMVRSVCIKRQRRQNKPRVCLRYLQHGDVVAGSQVAILAYPDRTTRGSFSAPTSLHRSAALMWNAFSLHWFLGCLHCLVTTVVTTGRSSNTLPACSWAIIVKHPSQYSVKRHTWPVLTCYWASTPPPQAKNERSWTPATVSLRQDRLKSCIYWLQIRLEGKQTVGCHSKRSNQWEGSPEEFTHARCLCQNNKRILRKCQPERWEWDSKTPISENKQETVNERHVGKQAGQIFGSMTQIMCLRIASFAFGFWFAPFLKV